MIYDSLELQVHLNKKLSWCWQTRATRLKVNQGHQTVAFHMLGIVSSCATVTLSLRRAVFTTVDFKKCRDLEIGVRGLKVIQGHWKRYILYTGYGFLLVFYRNFVAITCTVIEIFAFSNIVTLKSGSKVTEGHW